MVCRRIKECVVSRELEVKWEMSGSVEIRWALCRLLGCIASCPCGGRCVQMLRGKGVKRMGAEETLCHQYYMDSALTGGPNPACLLFL